MAYGGGIFSEQNKSLPGAYINFNTVASTTSIFGTRGTVALALPISCSDSILEWTFEDFKNNCENIFHIPWDSKDSSNLNYHSVRAIRETFVHATKVIIGGLLNYNNKTSSCDDDYFSVTSTGNYDGWRIRISVQHGTDDKLYGSLRVYSGLSNDDIKYEVGIEHSESTYTDSETLVKKFISDFNKIQDIFVLTYKSAPQDYPVVLRLTGAALTLSKENALAQHKKVIEGLSKKSFNILACVPFDSTTTEYETDNNIKKAYDEFTKDQRDNYGVKFQTVYFDYPDANHESAISLSKENNKDLIFWTAGALAGASFAESLCNKTYDGELELSTLGADQDPATLENAIATGSFIFHTVGDSVRVLDDINTYINAGENKEKDPEIFNDNQSIRVIDQIGNDIATIFVNNYLGKIPSDDSGRSSFWNALVDYHNQMQDLGGIQNFTSSDISVTAGTQRNSVVVNEVITLGSTMKKLYMTVTVQ